MPKAAVIARNYAREAVRCANLLIRRGGSFEMTRNLKFLNHIALVALTLCLSAAIGKAQNAYDGKFTLPFETHWGGAVLPAGDYTISIPSESTPYLLYV